jgi:polysaccharide pyruvyl transferase WcaK-like protein
VRRRSVGVFGYYGNANTGDEAILRVIVEQLGRRGRSDELIVFSDDPDDTHSIHHVDAVDAVLPESARDWMIGCLGRSRSRFFATIRAYRGLNVGVFGGGGLLFDSPEGNSWLLRDLRRLKSLKSRGVGVAVFAVGVGPLHRDDSRQGIRDVLCDVDLITVRDPESAELLVDCGLSAERIHIGADLVWALEPSPDV